MVKHDTSLGLCPHENIIQLVLVMVRWSTVWKLLRYYHLKLLKLHVGHAAQKILKIKKFVPSRLAKNDFLRLKIPFNLLSLIVLTNFK